MSAPTVEVSCLQPKSMEMAIRKV